jgi:hypothetical protein
MANGFSILAPAVKGTHLAKKTVGVPTARGAVWRSKKHILCIVRLGT